MCLFIYLLVYLRFVENPRLPTQLDIRSWKLILATQGTTLLSPPPKNWNGLTSTLLVATLGFKMDSCVTASCLEGTGHDPEADVIAVGGRYRPLNPLGG